MAQPRSLSEAVALSTKMRQSAEVKIDFYKKQIEEAAKGKMPAWQPKETVLFAREEIRRLETEQKSWDRMANEAKIRVDADALQTQNLKSLSPDEFVNGSPDSANKPLSAQAEDDVALNSAFPRDGLLEGPKKKVNAESLRDRLREALKARAENLRAPEEGDSENTGSATGAAASLLDDDRRPASVTTEPAPSGPVFSLAGAETDAEVKKLVNEGRQLQYSWLGAEDGPSLFEIVRKSIRAHAPDWQKTK